MAEFSLEFGLPCFGRLAHKLPRWHVPFLLYTEDPKKDLTVDITPQTLRKNYRVAILTQIYIFSTILRGRINRSVTSWMKNWFFNKKSRTPPTQSNLSFIHFAQGFSNFDPFQIIWFIEFPRIEVCLSKVSSLEHNQFLSNHFFKFRNR